jgi:hypothetical protein
LQESSQEKSFSFRMMKNCQHQLKGKPHTQEKSQDAATTMEAGITNRIHTSGIETSCEEAAEFHAQEATGCHHDGGGNRTKY